MDIKLLPSITYFLTFCSLSFHCVDNAFQWTNMFNFDKDQLIIFLLWLQFFVSYLRNIVKPKDMKLSSMFFL